MTFKAGFQIMTPEGPAVVASTKGQSEVTVWAPVGGLTQTFKASKCRAIATPDGKWIPPVLGTLYVGQDVRFLDGTVHQVGKPQKGWLQCGCHNKWQQAYSILVRNLAATDIAAAYDYSQCQPIIEDAAWKNAWVAWGKQLQPTHLKAVTNYTSNWYAEVNRALRAGTPATDPSLKYVDRLDSAIALGVAPRPMIVYRAGSRKFDASTPVGTEFSDAGFGSTSIRRAFALGWGAGCLFEIRVPAGATGAFIGYKSTHKHEDEYLLPRNCTYRVVSSTTVNDRPYFVVDLIGWGS